MTTSTSLNVSSSRRMNAAAAMTGGAEIASVAAVFRTRRLPGLCAPVAKRATTTGIEYKTQAVTKIAKHRIH